MSNDVKATRLSDRNESTRAGWRSSPDIKPRYLTTPGAAIHLGLSPRTLEKHRYYGTGPVYRKLGGRVVYAIDDLDAWAELGARRSTADPGVGIVHPAKHIASAVLQKKLARKR